MKATKSPPSIKGQDYSKEEISKARDEGKILTISPCTKGKCNFSCLFCYTDTKMKSTYPCRQMCLDEYSGLLIQAKELGARTVRIAGWGEPFMDPIFYDERTQHFPLIEFANSIGLYFVFFTNGSFITERIAGKLLELDVSVIAKMNTFSSSIQNKISGNSNAYDLMQQGIKALLAAGFNRQDPPRMAVESMLCKLNHFDAPNLYRWLRERSIVPSFQLIMHGGKGKNEQWHLTKDEAKALFQRLLEIDETEFGYSWFPCPPYVGTTCDKLFYNLVVDPYGNVQPCYAIDEYAGNIRESRLADLLESDVFKKTRYIEKYVDEPCRSCKIENCNYGCRCDTFNCGNLYGPYELCWNSSPRLPCNR